MIQTRTAQGVAAALLIVLAVGGCTRIRDTKGYLYDPVMVASVAPNVDNKASVMRVLGRPSFESEFDKNVWYYVSQSTEQFAFRNPRAKEHQVMVVRFDAKGTVSQVEKLGRDQLVSIDPADDKTPTRGKEIGFLQQLFGNIGRFSGAPGGGGPQ
jgi:outer membrane protein assembly factor BamE (lipoprotein component of BamABCDE complex)